MAYSLGEELKHPFVRETQAGGEMGARAGFYGKKIRTDNKGESGLYWSYGKKVWARIGGGSVALGFAGGETNSNRLGDLSLYTARRHLPKLPLLMGIDVSNEGQMGSLIKGTFSFTVYPEVSRSSMALGAIEGAYFVPGKNCSVSFGWSTYAAQACASRFSFKGVIYNFNWSVNTDMSVSTQVSVITAATIAVGAPGALSIPKEGASAKTTPPKTPPPNPPPSAGSSGAFNPLDPKQVPVVGFDLASLIDEVMAELNPLGGSAGSAGAGGGGGGVIPPVGGAPEELYGIKAWETKADPGGSVNRYGLVFGALGIPWQPEPPSTDEVIPNIGSSGSSGSSGSGSGSSGIGNLYGSSGAITKPIVKKYWYVNFGSIEKYLNDRLAPFNMNNGVKNTIDVAQNLTRTYDWTKSAYPMDVMWNFTGYKGNDPVGSGWNAKGVEVMITPQVKAPIGGIWFGTDHIKKTWREFFTDKSAHLTQKSIMGFLTELGKRANEASGDNWQLGTTVVEDYDACGGGGGKTKSVISVEDFGYAPDVRIFKFEASGVRPMIKGVSISCKPPAPLATAAYVGGRSGDLDLPTGNTGKVGGNPEPSLDELGQAAFDIGINNAWGDAYKAALKLRKKNEAEHHAKKNSIYPVDFSVTVDGISGFKFGDAVTTNLIPANYVGKMFFTVTKISHKVDAMSWETTLNTAARMK